MKVENHLIIQQSDNQSEQQDDWLMIAQKIIDEHQETLKRLADK